VSRIVPELSEDQLKRLPSGAEALVYKQCRDSLGPSTLVVFSLPWIRISPHGTPRDGETDFILFDEKRGILVIEVKGGGVQIDGGSGEWFSCQFGQQRSTGKTAHTCIIGESSPVPFRSTIWRDCRETQKCQGLFLERFGF